MRHSRPYLTPARSNPYVQPAAAPSITSTYTHTHSLRFTVSMSPLDRPQLQNKPFKQRKSFGNYQTGKHGRKTGRKVSALCDCCLLSAATRKQEVAGIRSKFPNKIPVRERRYRWLSVRIHLSVCSPMCACSPACMLTCV